MKWSHWKIAAITVALASSSSVAAAENKRSEALPVGHCINLGNHMELQTERQLGKVLDKDDFRRIREAGFQTVRLPVNWSRHASTKAPFEIDQRWLALVEDRVDMALSNGLNVILNSHNFDELHTNPSASADRLAAYWSQISAHFAKHEDGRLWFEIDNEPHDKLTNANLMDTLAPSLAAIRKVSPHRPVIIGGENWSGVDSLATLTLPDDTAVYPTFHYYEPFAFTHQGASWISPRLPIGRRYGSDEDRARLAADVEKVKRYIARTGKVPFMGENGAFDSSPLDQRIAYHRAISAAFSAIDVPMCMWAYTNTFPFYDHKSGQWKSGLLRAIGLPGGK